MQSNETEIHQLHSHDLAVDVHNLSKRSIGNALDHSVPPTGERQLAVSGKAFDQSALVAYLAVAKGSKQSVATP